MAWRYKRRSSFKRNLRTILLFFSAISYLLDKIWSKNAERQTNASNGEKEKPNGHYTDFKLYLERKHVFNRVINDQWLDLLADIGGDSLYYLRDFIHQKKEKLVHKGSSTGSNKLSGLSCSDFDNLLYRLFEAMGFSVQRTGKADDQNCDLIINLEEQKLLLQAKHHKDSFVASADVQEALDAQKLYGCNGTMIISTTNFTTEAVGLANENMVGLVSKERLSVLLSKYLKENWS